AERPSEEQAETVEWIRACLADALRMPMGEIGVDDDFAELGLDSLLIHRVRRGLEERFGQLPRSALLEHNTLSRLASHLSSRSEPGASASVAESASAPNIRRSASAPDHAIAIIGAAARFPGVAD